MSNDFRPHVVMGIIILLLALALIVVTFVPKPPVRIQAPPGGGQFPPSSIVIHPSLIASQSAFEISHPL
jgi:hypothetical protein